MKSFDHQPFVFLLYKPCSRPACEAYKDDKVNQKKKEFSYNFPKFLDLRFHFFRFETMMITRGGAKAAKSLLMAAGPRLFSTVRTVSSHEALSASHILKPGVTSAWIWTRAPTIGGMRFASTITLGEKTPMKEEDANQKKTENESTGGDAAGGNNKGDKGIASYWGVEPNKITKEDGSEWKWNCFRVRYS